MKNSLMTRPDSFLDSFFNDGLMRGYSFGNNIDIYHADGKYTVEINIPGYKKEDIHIQFDNDILSVSAKHDDEEVNDDNREYVYRSRRHSEYNRQIRFENINSDAIDASYDNGVLKVTLPDKEKSEPAIQKIEVK